MSRHLRHERPALWWRPGAFGMTLTALILVSLGGGTIGDAAWGSAKTPPPTARESFGEPVSGHIPIALTGARGVTITAGASEARQRLGSIVGASSPGLTSDGAGLGAGVSILAARPSHLTVRGLLAARAPPLLAAT